MTITEVLNSIQFVVDSTGKRKAVQVDLATWEKIVTRLEDIEDMEELLGTDLEGEEIIPWEQAKSELKAEGVDV
jgi:hypothetical protein